MAMQAVSDDMALAAPETLIAAARQVIVCGATSQIGRMLLPRLVAAGYQVVALSRQGQPGWQEGFPVEVRWLSADIGQSASLASLPAAAILIHLAPLKLLPPALAAFARLGVKRVVAFSSSSKLSKARSPVAAERAFAAQLAAAEEALAGACAQHGMRWTIFQPTLIYGCGMDRNVTLIRRLIERLGFFPLLGGGTGLRQPVHADDLAAACVAVLTSAAAEDRCYVLGGAETLTYRDMVGRIFHVLRRPVRFLPIPVALFALALRVLALLPRYRDFNVAMAQRMNEDLVYDHTPANRDFGYRPRGFEP